MINFICIALFIFNFWLFYPGYLVYDWSHLLIYNFPLNDWHPVIYPFLLKYISNYFGYHIYYPLLFNLIPFYLGLYVLTLGLWKKYSSKKCLLGLLPVFIANIYFYNIVGHSSFSSPMFIFLLWAIVLYQILIGITRINSIFLFIAFLFAILSRHNALIQVYPIFFIYSYLIVSKLKSSSYLLLKYIGLLIAFAGFSILLAIGIPRLLKNEQSYPANHTFLLQIAGACVPHNDESCFNKDWYRNEKNYTDVEELYKAHPLFADKMVFGANSPFPIKKMEGLSSLWVEAIIKYPSDYLEHIHKYIKKMWHQPALQWDVFIATKNHCLTPSEADLLTGKYSESELFYEAPKFKIKVYNFLKKLLIEVPTIFFISLSYILFVVTGILFIKKRDILLLFSLSSSIAGIAGSIIFCMFTPTIDSRYIYPVLISSLMSVIGIIVWLCHNKITVFTINAKVSVRKIIAITTVFVLLYGIYNYFYGSLTARVDVFASYTDEPTFIIQQKDISKPTEEANWMFKGGNRGVVITEHGNNMTFTIVALQNVDINIVLRGPYILNSKNEVLESWVKYTSFKINGLSAIFENKNVWHNEPFKYVLHAQKNQTYTIQLKWRKK